LSEDKVYALLGITTARDDPRIVVDYNKGAREVYIDTTTYIIQSTNKLDIICSMQHASPSHLMLPSWVVDWTTGCPSPLSDGSLDQFHAAGTSEASAVIEFEETLRVKGLCIALCNDFHQSRSILGPPDEVSVGELLLFCKNFTCGRVLEGLDMLVHEFKEDTQLTILGLLAFLDPLPCFPLGRELAQLTQEVVEIYNRRFEVETLGKGVLLDLGTIAEFRRFFVCDNGLQGSAYDEAVVGCKVCILVGCATPVVLKPIKAIGVPTRFEVLGDAYINGYMNGEGMEKLKLDQCQLTDFIIN
jgi:hypothetical protein